MATTVVAATYGSLPEFDAENESVKSYTARAKIYFRANSIPDGIQASVLLSCIGGKTYDILESLLAPAPLDEATLDTLVLTLEEHFQPKPNVIAQRFTFHQRNQKPTESIAEYLAALRKLAIDCDFGAKEVLEATLRDRLVGGIRNTALQKKLLSTKNLTFKDACDVAKSVEAAEANAKAIGNAHASTTTTTSVHTVAKYKQKRDKPSTVSPLDQKKQQPCYRCGRRNHLPSACKFTDATCHSCGKKGHIAPVCHSRPKQPQAPRKRPQYGSHQPKPTHYVGIDAAPDVEEEELYLFALGSKSSREVKPIRCKVLVDEVPVWMEIDTGAEVSVMPEAVYLSLFPEKQLVKSSVILKTYTGEVIPVVGEISVQVRHNSQSTQTMLVVVSTDGPVLLGRDLLGKIKLDWQQLNQVRSEERPTLSAVLDQHKSVFKDELGTVRAHRAKLHVCPSTMPKFFKPRPIPFAIKDIIGAELDKMEKAGILEKISHSEWAAPIVTVPKKDGTYRICGDYKVTVNSALDVDQYPLPNPTDLFASLAGGQKFSKLDLSRAYQQLLLDDDSKNFTTINTHQGMYRYTRLPFGIASAPAIFQRTMDSILQGIPNVICYLDDILVTDTDDQAHLQNLKAVLHRLEECGLRVKLAKCEFMKASVEYLGHRVSSQGLHPLESKQDAIVQAPEPQNLQQLRSYLGLLNYYGKFIPNLATIAHPLHNLLRNNVKWSWTSECTRAFKATKQALVSSDVLIHYDPTLPISLAGDASAYGLGAVISHTLPDGTERPIAFASRTLSSAEQNYAQLEKEAASLIFGIKKFHQYLYGRKFTLVTDHKPLTAILGPKKGIPTLAAARLQRWAVLLSAYSYTIQFKPTADHSNADGLSRLPLPEVTLEGQSAEATIFNISQIENLPVTAVQVRQATQNDAVLSKVLKFTQQGWPKDVESDLIPYQNRAQELSVEDNCLLCGRKVVVPAELREKVLEELHATHPGIARMKAMARSHVWWPGIDKQIEAVVKSCLPCLRVKQTPASAPLHPWTWPPKPWQRIHVDFAGPFLNKMFFIIVDAHSKWPEIYEMSSTTSQSTINVLRHMFASYGLPLQLVSDNGPQFVAADFTSFLEENGVKHIRSAPYHPATNGLAERFVRSFKEAMKAAGASATSVRQKLENFLLCYRSTPHATTGVGAIWGPP